MCGHLNESEAIEKAVVNDGDYPAERRNTTKAERDAAATVISGKAAFQQREVEKHRYCV